MTDQIPTQQQIEAAIVRKVLLRLAPFLAILYVFSLLDRGNVGIAALGMLHDLHYSNKVYGFGAGIFYVGYFLFEVPSNLIMERVGARLWISRIMLTWGVLSASMMFVRSPMSFYCLRFVLGFAEAGFYPGVILYLTYWIPATSRARAISTFLSVTAMVNILGNVLSGLLMGLDGKYHLAGWQWLFLMEGLPSILLGLVVLAVLPDRPRDVRWLTEDEKGWLAVRLAAEAQNSQAVQHFSWRVALGEPRILLMCLIFLISSTGGNCIGAFGSLYVKHMSHDLWSNSFVAYVQIIPTIIGAAAMFFASFHSDRTGKRRAHVAIGYSICALGYIGCIFAPSASWVIAMLCVNAFGERIGAGSYWALTTNLLGARAAAGGIAMINSIGNLGSFFGPVLMGQMMQRTGGSYTPGLITAACAMFIAAAIGGTLRRHPTHTAVVEVAVEPVTSSAADTRREAGG